MSRRGWDGQDEKPSRVSTSGRSIEECRGEVEMDRMRNQAECQPVGEVSKNVQERLRWTGWETKQSVNQWEKYRRMSRRGWDGQDEKPSRVSTSGRSIEECPGEVEMDRMRNQAECQPVGEVSKNVEERLRWTGWETKQSVNQWEKYRRMSRRGWDGQDEKPSRVSTSGRSIEECPGEVEMDRMRNQAECQPVGEVSKNVQERLRWTGWETKQSVNQWEKYRRMSRRGWDGQDEKPSRVSTSGRSIEECPGEVEMDRMRNQAECQPVGEVSKNVQERLRWTGWETKQSVNQWEKYRIMSRRGWDGQDEKPSRVSTSGRSIEECPGEVEMDRMRNQAECQPVGEVSKNVQERLRWTGWETKQSVNQWEKYRRMSRRGWDGQDEKPSRVSTSGRSIEECPGEVEMDRMRNQAECQPVGEVSKNVQERLRWTGWETKQSVNQWEKYRRMSRRGWDGQDEKPSRVSTSGRSIEECPGEVEMDRMRNQAECQPVGEVSKNVQERLRWTGWETKQSVNQWEKYRRMSRRGWDGQDEKPSRVSTSGRSIEECPGEVEMDRMRNQAECQPVGEVSKNVEERLRWTGWETKQSVNQWEKYRRMSRRGWDGQDEKPSRVSTSGRSIEECPGEVEMNRMRNQAECQPVGEVSKNVEERLRWTGWETKQSVNQWEKYRRMSRRGWDGQDEKPSRVSTSGRSIEECPGEVEMDRMRNQAECQPVGEVSKNVQERLRWTGWGTKQSVNQWEKYRRMSRRGWDGQDEKPSRVSTSGRSIEECRGEVEMDRMRNQAECQPVGEVSKNVQERLRWTGWETKQSVNQWEKYRRMSRRGWDGQDEKPSRVSTSGRSIEECRGEVGMDRMRNQAECQPVGEVSKNVQERLRWTGWETKQSVNQWEKYRRMSRRGWDGQDEKPSRVSTSGRSIEECPGEVEMDRMRNQAECQPVGEVSKNVQARLRWTGWETKQSVNQWEKYRRMSRRGWDGQDEKPSRVSTSGRSIEECPGEVEMDRMRNQAECQPVGEVSKNVEERLRWTGWETKQSVNQWEKYRRMSRRGWDGQDEKPSRVSTSGRSIEECPGEVEMDRMRNQAECQPVGEVSKNVQDRLRWTGWETKQSVNQWEKYRRMSRRGWDGQDEKPSRVSTSGRSIEECRGEVGMDRMRNQAECQPVGEVSKNVQARLRWTGWETKQSVNQWEKYRRMSRRGWDGQDEKPSRVSTSGRSIEECRGKEVEMIRSNGLYKKIVQGTVPGKRKRGRQKKRWEDNIREWTGLDFNSSQRAAEDRQRWQKIVADVNSGAPTSLMVPGHRYKVKKASSNDQTDTVLRIQSHSTSMNSPSNDCTWNRAAIPFFRFNAPVESSSLANT